MKKQLITVGLLLSMLTSVGCGSADNQPVETGDAPLPETTLAETTEPVEEVDPLMDDLGEFDFDGYPYRVLSVKYDPATAFTLFDTQTTNGDVLNDALYKRNREIEERFHIKFVSFEDTYKNNYSTLKNSVNSNSDEYDMIQVINRNAFSAALDGLLVPASEMTYLNPEKDYYMQELNEQLSIAGKNFFYYSDESIHTFERAACLIYNKEIAEDHGLENYYNLVREGKWTLDKLYADAQKVTSDLDGNGVYDKNDRFGLIGCADYVYPSLYNGAGVMTIRKDNEDIPYFAALGSDRFATVIDGILSQLNSGDHIRVTSKSNFKDSVADFANDSALFAGIVIGRLTNAREMESDYGLLPFPKYDETQEQYYSRVVDGWLHVVPATNPDPERTSVIMEALASGTARHIIPAYYDNVLSIRALRDEDSVEMLDLIRSTLVVDLGECPWYSTVRTKYSYDLLYDQKVQLASLNASLAPQVDALIENALKALDVSK